MEKETFDTLWKYCTDNNRLCPMPTKWIKLFEMLKNKTQDKPSLPLILAGWEHTVPLQKYLVFKEHIQWASDNKQIEEIGIYLRSLPEENWAHYGEILTKNMSKEISKKQLTSQEREAKREAELKRLNDPNNPGRQAELEMAKLLER